MGGDRSAYLAEVHELTVWRVMEEGWSHKTAAEMIKVSERTVQIWVRQRREELALAPKRKPRRAHSEQQRGDAVRLVLEEGMTVAYAARSAAVSPASVHNWIREAEHVRGAAEEQRTAPPARARAEAVRLFLEEGLSKREIARMLGLRQAVLSDWVRQAQEAQAASPLPCAEREVRLPRLEDCRADSGR